MERRVYLDYAASMPLDKRVKEAMDPYWSEVYANPNGLHKEGKDANRAITEARETIAGFIGARPDELIFTSGGTESNTLAVAGFAEVLLDKHEMLKGMHFITSTIEHSSVLGCFERFARRGADVDFIGTNKDGIVDVNAFEKALKEETVLVSVMHVNNEIGTYQPIEKMARLTRKHAPQALFHTDASQVPLFLSVDVSSLDVDLLSLDAQKLYGPKGIGALFIRRGVTINRVGCGGKQERGLRPGTQAVPLIVGFGKAYEIAEEEREVSMPKMRKVRDYFIEEIQKRIPFAVLNGSKDSRAPNSVNFSFPGFEGEFLVLGLDESGVAAATRSACMGSGGEGSYVVASLDPLPRGDGPARARSAVRFTLGKETTKEDIDFVVSALVPLLTGA